MSTMWNPPANWCSDLIWKLFIHIQNNNTLQKYKTIFFIGAGGHKRYSSTDKEMMFIGPVLYGPIGGKIDLINHGYLM